MVRKTVAYTGRQINRQSDRLRHLDDHMARVEQFHPCNIYSEGYVAANTQNMVTFDSCTSEPAHESANVH